MNQSELGPFDLFEIFSSFLNLISIFVILSFFCFSLSRSGNRGQSNSSISFRDKDLWSRNAVRRNSSQRLFPRPLCPEYSIFCPTFCAICFAIYTLGFRPSIRCLFLRRVISSSDNVFPNCRRFSSSMSRRLRSVFCANIFA